MLRLSSADKETLSGARGDGAQFAIQMIVRVTAEHGAGQLIDFARACYQGQVDLDFARRLSATNTRLSVPATLTACFLDLRDGQARTRAIDRRCPVWKVMS